MAHDIDASVYKHEQESVQRPDVGVEPQFTNKKAPKTYRYDSSLAPEISWDENPDRAFAEWLLALIADAAEDGEQAVFAQPQVWQDEERFASLSQCAARLRSLTKPFLNWAGKAERQQVTEDTCCGGHAGMSHPVGPSVPPADISHIIGGRSAANGSVGSSEVFASGLKLPVPGKEIGKPFFHCVSSTIPNQKTVEDPIT